MKKEITIILPPDQAADSALTLQALQRELPRGSAPITGFHILKKSIDARSPRIKVRIVAEVFAGEPAPPRANNFNFRDVSRSAQTAVIIGAGPAGLFAALRLLECGIRPVILERGPDVRERRRDLAALNKKGILNPESNYCFGEGGAGTYSDGKLYTRSSKRGSIDRILRLFVHFGADEKILYEAHPHIGTNKLPGIIAAMREAITGHGGRVAFGKKVVDFGIVNGNIDHVVCSDGEKIRGDQFILATGHSARDIFELLIHKGITIQAKPFALGIRVEHPQELIDCIQYSQPDARQWLPPSSYSLVQQVNNRGVFSFCMCPGGIIAPASTSQGELVVNGWSPSRRNNPFANSGIVVQVEAEDAHRELADNNISPGDPLLFMHFQKKVEQAAYASGGGSFVAPAQRLADFCERKSSSTLPACSYVPGINSVNLSEVLPGFIYNSLAEAFRIFGKRMNKNQKGFFTNEAVVVATESRTSSPVRIPRDPESLQHIQISNLYPCGEGAGYAGGIVSAAMDGERVADKISERVANP